MQERDELRFGAYLRVEFPMKEPYTGKPIWVKAVIDKEEKIVKRVEASPFNGHAR